MVLPEPPHVRQGVLPLLQNVHFFHACLLDIYARGSLERILRYLLMFLISASVYPLNEGW